MRELLKSSVGCQDGANLRSTIHELCTGLGEISHFDVLTLSRSGKHQALCFFRLESPAQEKRLMTNLGVTRFGSELLFVVDLPQEAKPAEQPEDSGHGPTGRDDALRHPVHGRNENAGEKGFWLSPPRWSGALLGAARRVLDREAGWPSKGAAR